jgi:type VI secretion system secreted protein Hcp
MAVDFFLKIDDVKGESTDDKHKDEIEVLNWNWSMTQTGTTHSGPGGGAGKVNVQDVAITKYVDKSTPILMKQCCSGNHFKEAKLTLRKAGGKEAVEYLVLTMKEIIISSVTAAGTDHEKERVKETITLNFAEFEVNYTPQDATGGKQAAIPAGYHIAQNKITK